MRTTGRLASVGVAIALFACPAFAQTQFLYWSGSDGVERISVRGDNRSTILASDSAVFGLAFDRDARELYWLSDFSAMKSAPDGGGVVEVVDFSGATEYLPWALALDTHGRLSGGQARMYVSSDDRILSANLDGTNLQTAIVFPNDDPEVYSIEIDFAEQRFFWSVGNS
jgi:hypothetical protein